MEFKIIPCDRVQVYLLFYKPKTDDPMLNRLVAFFDGPFCHVEMAFAEKWGDQPWEKELWGSSIYQNETVFFKPKTYVRDGYVSIALEITLPQMYKIKAYCKEAQKKKIAFSRNAMFAAYLPFYQFVNTEDTFCSKHVTAALLHGGVTEVKGLNPSLITPSKLYNILSNQIVQVIVPSKLFAHGTGTQCTATMVRDLL